ncbi:hypothetical protein ABZX77_39560 [Streptomyces sp. NPDC004237]
MDNPFRDAGPVDRALPWLSAAFVVLVLVGRFSYVVIRRDRVRRRNRLGR